MARPFARKQASFTISRATKETDLVSVFRVIKVVIAIPHLLSTKEFTLVQNPVRAVSVGKLLFITHLLLPIRKCTTRKNPSLKVVLLGIRETTPGRSLTCVMSVGKLLFKTEVLQNMSKFLLEREPMNVLSVGRPLLRGQSS